MSIIPKLNEKILLKFIKNIEVIIWENNLYLIFILIKSSNKLSKVIGNELKIIKFNLVLEDINVEKITGNRII